MRLYINETYFISVINTGTKGYSCQVMMLVHGIGMQTATIHDPEQKDIVSCIVHPDTFGFTETNKNLFSLDDLFKFHQEKLFELQKQIL